MEEEQEKRFMHLSATQPRLPKHAHWQQGIDNKMALMST